MTRVLCAVVVCACVVWGFVGEAIAYDGSELLGYCIGLDQLSNTDNKFLILGFGLCIGYVEGVRDTLRGEKTYCLPERVEPKQAAQVVTKYLQNIIVSPELKDTASSIVQRAFTEAFPCPEGGK